MDGTGILWWAWLNSNEPTKKSELNVNKVHLVQRDKKSRANGLMCFCSPWTTGYQSYPKYGNGFEDFTQALYITRRTESMVSTVLYSGTIVPKRVRNLAGSPWLPKFTHYPCYQTTQPLSKDSLGLSSCLVSLGLTLSLCLQTLRTRVRDFYQQNMPMMMSEYQGAGFQAKSIPKSF